MNQSTRRWFKTMIVAVAIIALGTLAGTASATPISFTLTGTASTSDMPNNYGYIDGQDYTFQFIVNSGFTNNTDSVFTGTANYWADELVTQAPIFSDVGGDGLTGSWQRPVAANNDPYSVLQVFENAGTQKLALRADNDGKYGIGLQANGADVIGIATSAMYFGGIFSYPGSYTNPNDYFAGYLGTYTPPNEAVIIDTIDGSHIYFTLSSVTIAAIPEPASAILVGLGVVALVFRRRHAR